MKPRYCAVILAAGLSSRMGTPKPLLPLGDVPAIKRVVGTVISAGVLPIVVTGHRAEAVSNALVGAGAVTAENKGYAGGMLTSVRTGVNALPETARAFFLLPGDCCAVRPETLTALIRVFEENLPRGIKIVYPAFEARRGHPPIISRGLAEPLMKFRGEGGAKTCLEGYPSAELPVSDVGILLDMDTPRGYAEMQKHLRCAPEMSPEAARALHRKYDTSENIVSHCEDVAELADKIASEMNTRGFFTDGALLNFAALTHDISRGEPEHAARGAELLLREGYPAAAMLTAGHMEPPEENDGREAEILFLADKLSRRGKITRPEETIKAMGKRFDGDAEAQTAMLTRMNACVRLLNKYGETYGVDCFKNG